MNKITFVDKEDRVVGSGSKAEALRDGIIHRVIRIFIFDIEGNLLIQLRGPHVFSLPGRWDQSVAGHVDVGESYRDAAHRELSEELGIVGVSPTEMWKYYSVETDEASLKMRFNMIYTLAYTGRISYNSREIAKVK